MAPTTHPLLPEEGGWERGLTMRVGGGEGKQVGWGATDRLCHCLSAPPAVLSSLRCTWGMGTWRYREGWGAGDENGVSRIAPDGCCSTTTKGAPHLQTNRLNEVGTGFFLAVQIVRFTHVSVHLLSRALHGNPTARQYGERVIWSG